MRGFFRKNLGMKAFSLFLAFVLWSSIVSRAPEVRWFTIPIEIMTGDDQVVVSSEQRRAEISLRGDTTVLNRISQEQLRAVVPVDQNGPGRHTIVVVPAEIQGVPRGVTEIEIHGSGFEITLDRKETKLLPVEIQFSGDVSPGYKVENVTIQPTLVEVTGPASSFGEVEAIPTEHIEIGDVTDSFTRPVKLVPPGKLLRAAPSSVRVDFEIVEIRVQQTINLAVIPSQDGWTTEPSEVQVTLEAPPSMGTRIREELSTRVLVESLPPGGGEAVVTIDFGAFDTEEMPRIRIVEISPPKVRALAPRPAR